MLRFPHDFLDSLKGIPVNDRFMHVFENRPIVLGIVDTVFLFEGLGVGFEIDYISAVLLARQNLLDRHVSPLIRIGLRFLSASANPFISPVRSAVQMSLFL